MSLSPELSVRMLASLLAFLPPGKSVSCPPLTIDFPSLGYFSSTTLRREKSGFVGISTNPVP